MIVEDSQANRGGPTSHRDPKPRPDSDEPGFLERTRAAAAAGVDEDGFRTLATHAPVGIFVCDAAGRCLFANAQWEKIAGVTSNAENGPSWLDAVDENDRRRVADGWRQASATGAAWQAEFHFRRPDGTISWVQASAVALQSSAEGRYLGTVVDVATSRSMERDARLLAAIVETSIDAIISKNLDGVITSWNKSAERLFGYTAEEAVGRHITLLIPADRQEEEPGILARIRAGERIEHFETKRVRKDGTLLDISLSISPIRGADGAISGASKIARDITQRKRAEAQLRRQEQELQQQARTLEIVNRLSSALVAERDLRRIVQHVAAAAGAVSGATRFLVWHQTVSATGEEGWIPDSGMSENGETPPTVPTELLPALAAAGCVRLADVRADTRGAEWCAAFGGAAASAPLRSVLAVPVISRSGQLLAAIFLGDEDVGAFTDETERIVAAIAAQAAIAIDNSNLYAELKRELVQHKRAERALRSSERQLRLVTDNAIVYLAQCDRDCRLKFVNRPYAERFGRTPPELIGRTLPEVMGERAHAAIQPYLEAAFAGQRVEFELEIPYEQAGDRWMRVIHEPERSAEGEVIGIIAVISDITTRKHAEREMEQARDQALAASRAKDDFLAALSHELRTPLNPVLLLASEASEDRSLSDRVRSDFEVVRKNVELEARLIDDLLDLTRITRGKLALSFGTHALRTILRDAIETIRPEIMQKQLQLDCEFEDRGALVWADAVRLQQVLWNVVKNAVKFTPEGGRVSVRVSADTDRGVVAVEVVDTGIGMTQPELDRVFDAFAQGEHAAGGGSHRFGGLGLGLAISKLLTELHRGTIRATSEGRNRGSRFVLELPLCGFADTTEGTAEPAMGGRYEVPGEQPRRTGRRRILLVEDHDATRSALAQLLVRRNYDVTVSATMAEARSLAGRAPFDLVISDVGLPDGNGHELMGELRRERPNLVGIALTGYGMDHDLVRSQSAGFTVHLTKPVTIQALDQALATALDGHAGAADRAPGR